ncbi:hypothetical protein Tco_0988561 [Tanacetum coccineum]|uniref:Reverse transcriptase n=1 Tax=Tanacetum coccineum TaxID=301880 RepID=A0ABQ5ERH3_9ASTR
MNDLDCNSQQSTLVAKGYAQEEDQPENSTFLRKALYGLKQSPRAWYDEPYKHPETKGLLLRTSDPPVSQKGILSTQAKYALRTILKSIYGHCHSMYTIVATKPYRT